MTLLYKVMCESWDKCRHMITSTHVHKGRKKNSFLFWFDEKQREKQHHLMAIFFRSRLLRYFLFEKRISLFFLNRESSRDRLKMEFHIK